MSVVEQRYRAVLAVEFGMSVVEVAARFGVSRRSVHSWRARVSKRSYAVGVMTDDSDDRSMRERMLAGDLYIADDPELSEHSLRARDLMDAFNAMSARDPDQRRRLLTELLAEIGEGTEIRPPLRVDYGSNIHIGARSFVNLGLVALDGAPITIGDDVQIGPNVQLLTPTHPIDPRPRRDKWEAAEPISIGDNVWLGGGVIVLPGVTIGNNTVVGAGAVVTRDLPANVIAGGNPARVLRTINAEPS